MGCCQAPLGAGSCPRAQLPAQPNPSSAHRALTHLSPQFGESQQLRMVRILRSTLMVRVGGGWIALDEFLVKNDPCRGGHGRPCAQPAPRGSGLCALGSHCLCCPSPVKGRTNLKINEKYLSPDAFGATAAKCAGNQSAPSSKVLSPSRSNSSLSLYSSASAPSSPLARKVRAGEPRAPVLAALTPPQHYCSPCVSSLPSRCCGGRALGTGAPAPGAPCCPTGPSCSSPRPRRARTWHPQVRAVPTWGGGCGAAVGWAGLGEQGGEAWGAGAVQEVGVRVGSVPQPQERGSRSSPAPSFQSRPRGPPQSAAAPAAEPPQPPALRPAPLAGPTQDSSPRRPPATGLRTAKLQPCAPRVSGPRVAALRAPVPRCGPARGCPPARAELSVHH